MSVAKLMAIFACSIGRNLWYSSAFRIANSTDDALWNEWKFVVRLDVNIHSESVEFDRYTHGCLGSLVDNRGTKSILTAAHCFVNNWEYVRNKTRLEEFLKITATTVNIFGTVTVTLGHKTTKIVSTPSHPRITVFRRLMKGILEDSFYDIGVDVAAIKLNPNEILRANDLQFLEVEIGKIPSDYPVGLKCKSVGLGFSERWHKDEVLQQIHFTVVSVKSCGLGYYKTLPFCLQSVKTHVTAGDSGSPILCELACGRYYFAGVVALVHRERANRARGIHLLMSPTGLTAAAVLEGVPL